MASPVDPVLSHHTSHESQPAAVPELLNDKPHQSPKQCHAENHTEQTEVTSEKIIVEEQAGCRAGRSTTEQIFNLQILCEKYLQHQRDLYHVFIDFKKTFDRVWHAALWATMKKYNISTTLIPVIQNLFDMATNAVFFNGSIGDWFRTTVGARQGRLLSPTFLNIFLERIMTDAL